MLAHIAVAQAAVVPAGQLYSVGVPLALSAPLVDGVVFNRALALAKPDGRSGIGLEGAVVVGNHQRVAAQCEPTCSILSTFC